MFGVHLRVNDFVVDSVTLAHTVLQAERIRMRAEPAKDSIYGIQFGVAEETYPKLEVAAVPSRCIDMTARSLPEAAPPERGLLLDVAICA